VTRTEYWSQSPLRTWEDAVPRRHRGASFEGVKATFKPRDPASSRIQRAWTRARAIDPPSRSNPLPGNVHRGRERGDPLTWRKGHPALERWPTVPLPYTKGPCPLRFPPQSLRHPVSLNHPGPARCQPGHGRTGWRPTAPTATRPGDGPGPVRLPVAPEPDADPGSTAAADGRTAGGPIGLLRTTRSSGARGPGNYRRPGPCKTAEGPRDAPVAPDWSRVRRAAPPGRTRNTPCSIRTWQAWPAGGPGVVRDGSVWGKGRRGSLRAVRTRCLGAPLLGSSFAVAGPSPGRGLRPWNIPAVDGWTRWTLDPRHPQRLLAPEKPGTARPGTPRRG